MKNKLWMYLFYTLCTVLLGCQEWQRHECTCIHDDNSTAIYHPQVPEPTDITQAHRSAHTSPVKGITSILKTISGSPLKHQNQSSSGDVVGSVQETDNIDNGCIDINLDDLNKLTKLPGIGPGKAKSIIQTREKRPFKRKKDITRVKGIGLQTYKKLSDQICDISNR